MTIKFELLRPDDLLNLQFEADNLKLDTSQPDHPALVLENPQQPGYLIVTFPPQTIVEQAFYKSSQLQPPSGETSNPYNTDHPPESTPLPPVQARIGGNSRLVFSIPPGDGFRLPYTLEDLLNWDQLELNVSKLANIPAQPSAEQRQSAPGIQQPERLDTAIELPYRLILSPNHTAVWQHSQKAKTVRGITELWHTRMAQKIAGGTIQDLSRKQPAPLRAIWSPDYNPNKFSASDPPLFGQPDSDWGILTAMTPSDRHEIVVLTSAFHGFVKDKTDLHTYEPAPFYAEQLFLSPLGGWLRSRGQWDPPAPFKPLVWIGPAVEHKWDQYLQDFTKLQAVRPKDRVFLPGVFSAPESPVHAAETPGTKDRPNPTIRAVSASQPDSSVLLPSEFTNLIEANIGTIFWPPLLGTTGDLLNLSEWTHIASMGRDHYVRIVYEGHLYPFGHRASLVKITERKIRDVPGPDGVITPLAYLVQRMFIVVRQPLRDYNDPTIKPHLQNNGRGLPFQSIRLTTLTTPDIAYPPGGSQIQNTIYSFWVRLGEGKSFSDDFKFHAIGQDVAGNPVDFTASLIFVPFSENRRDLVLKAYTDSDEERACLVPGQKMTYAPPAPGGASENTNLKTNKLYFTTHSAPVDKKFGGFLPKMLMADVNLPAVEALLGKPAGTRIAFANDFLNASPNNTTGLFAQIVEETTPGILQQAKLLSEFAAKDAGGFATPNLSISGLTSHYGPLAGSLSNAASDIFDPNDFFNDVKDAAKLFDSISLIDLLAPLTMGAGAPKIQFNKEDLASPPPSLKFKLVTTLDWTPNIKNQDVDAGIVTFHPKKNGNQAKLEVKGRLEKTIELPPPTNPDPGFTKMDGSLTNFTIELLHVVEILFSQFAFHTETGKKLSVTVDLDPGKPVEFKDDLQFVEQLRQVIPPGLFGDGPSLDINLTRVKAGFSIGLPPLAVGVFSLKEVTMAAFLELPFLEGRPLFDFSFSSREHPFNLTVMIFGGGGFFHLQIDTLGVKMLEAALEFGASASIDLGVASGGVHIMAGIYFSMQRRTIGGQEVDAATLAGYLRMGGELSILGLISVSLEFYLTFAYEVAKNAAYGRATLTVKVEVLFFSKSVEITVEKRFGGTSGDPNFLDAFNTPAVWDTYASAFA